MIMKKKRTVTIFIIATLLLLSLIALIIMNLDKNEENKGKQPKVNEKIKLSFKDRISNVKEFVDKDNTVVGWIQVQGTNIDYPVMFTSILQKKVDYSYGWRSPRYTTGENREVILGHNLINVSNKPIYDKTNLKNFESLMNFTYSSFAKDNQYIKYTKNNQEDLYVVYAVGFYDYDYDDSESFNNESDINKYIKEVRKNSIYNYDIDVNSSDEIITLKTCTRYFGVSEKQQFVIDARKVREDEEIVKYNVEKNNNYKKLGINDIEVN